MQKKMDLKPKHKKTLKLVAKILFIIFMITYFEWVGLVALTTFFIVFALYRLFFVRWDDFINTKQIIETSIWGRPLKDFKKGELKNHKVEITWRKGKTDKKKYMEKKKK